MRKAFGYPGFTRLFVGITVSAFGDSIMLLVLSIWVKTLTGSNAAAGITFFFMLAASLFAPALGVWVDRVRRRPMLVWGHLASALIVVPLFFVTDAAHVWLIWAVAFLYGVSFIVLPAALNGLLKELLPEDLLAEANGAMQTTRESFRLGGPLLGAILFAWLGAWPVVLIDIVSFLVGAALIAGVRVTEAAPVRRASHLWHELTAGVRSLAQDLVMRHVLVGFVLTLVVIGFAETSLYAVLDAYGKPPTFVAVVSTIQGVGAVAAGLLSSRIIGAIGEVATMVVGFVVLAAGLGVVAATGALWVMLAGCAIIGLALPPLFVGFTTLLQKRTPQEVMGRASMAVEVVMSTPQALSMAIGAALVAIVSYRVIFLIMAVAAVASAAYITATLSGQIRADLGAVTAAAAPTPEASRPSAP